VPSIDELVQQVLRDKAHPHHCLGVAPTAFPAAVRRRYLSLALRLHPDKLVHPQAHEAFTAVEAAYAYLENAAASSSS
jgi:curved DNA-binding protein CbpA